MTWLTLLKNSLFIIIAFPFRLAAVEHHVKVMNSEMGEVRDAIREFSRSNSDEHSGMKQEVAGLRQEVLNWYKDELRKATEGK